MTNYIKEWKQNEEKELYEGYQVAKEKIKEYKEKYGYKAHSYTEFQRIPKLYKDLYGFNEENIKLKIAEAVEIHFKTLQGKVEKKIGKIITIESLSGTGYDYRFTGKTGNCVIRLINAGGYNIQCSHTRWIIK